MVDLQRKIDSIREAQATIDTLLASKSVVVDGGKSVDTWSIEELYAQEDCNLGFAYSDIGGRTHFPMHVHADSIEYLICVRGRLLLNIENKVTRVMNVGDCASIPVGVTHNTTPLEPYSKLVYVCIPPDITFPLRKVG